MRTTIFKESYINVGTLLRLQSACLGRKSRRRIETMHTNIKAQRIWPRAVARLLFCVGWSVTLATLDVWHWHSWSLTWPDLMMVPHMGIKPKTARNVPCQANPSRHDLGLRHEHKPNASFSGPWVESLRCMRTQPTR